MSAYTMLSSSRSEINIAHYDGNYYAISAHRPGDEEPSEVHLMREQMPQVARMLVDFVTEQIPLHGLGPEDRSELEIVFGALQFYLNRDLPYPSMASQGHGVIAALPSRGKIEFRVIDLDVGSSEPIGGRIYRVSPAVAAQWMLGNLLSSSELLSIGDVIAIRDAASKIITAKLSGEKEWNRISGLIKNAFIERWGREGEDLIVLQMRGLEQSDLDKLNLFIARHRPLQLDPTVMLRTGQQIDGLRQATVNIAVKLAYGVAAAIGAASFGAAIAELDSSGRLSYSELDRVEFSSSTAALYAKAFEEIEGKLKLLLTATTKTKVKLVSRVDTVSDWLTNRVTEHVAAQFAESTFNVTISKEQENFVADIANSWFLDTLGNALEANDLVAVMLTGIHAGSAIHLADVSEFGLIYPIRRVTNL